MKLKISQLLPLVGTIGGFLLLVLIGTESINFTLDPSHIWAFMSITIGSSIANKSLNKWRHN